MSDNRGLGIGDSMLLAANAAASAAAAQAANRAAAASERAANEFAAIRKLAETKDAAADALFKCKEWITDAGNQNTSPLLVAASADQWNVALSSIDTIHLPAISDKELRKKLITDLNDLAKKVSREALEETKWMLAYTKETHQKLRDIVVFLHLVHEYGRDPAPARSLRKFWLGIKVLVAALALAFWIATGKFENGVLAAVGFGLSLAVIGIFYRNIRGIGIVRPPTDRDKHVFSQYFMTLEEGERLLQQPPFLPNASKDYFIKLKGEYRQNIARYNKIYSQIYGEGQALRMPGDC